MRLAMRAILNGMHGSGTHGVRTLRARANVHAVYNQPRVLFVLSCFRDPFVLPNFIGITTTALRHDGRWARQRPSRGAWWLRSGRETNRARSPGTGTQGASLRFL